MIEARRSQVLPRPEFAGLVAALGVACAVAVTLALACSGRDRVHPPTASAPPQRPILHLAVQQEGNTTRVVTLGTGPDGVARGPLLDSTGAAWSPDGARVAYVAAGGMSLAVQTLAGDTRTALNAVSNFHPIFPWPAWSPDGRRIAVIEIGWCETGSATSYLGVVDLETGKVKRFGPYEFWDARGTEWGPTNFTMPRRIRWSPDGRRVLVAWDKTVALDPDTGRSEVVVDRPVLAEWAPEGRAINYIDVAGARRSREGNLGPVYYKPLGGSELRVLDRLRLETGGATGEDATPDIADMAVSPGDGGLIAVVYGSSRIRASRLLIVNTGPDGRMAIERPVLNATVEGVVLAIDWAPDGRDLAVLVSGAPGIQLRSLSIDGQTWRTVATLDISENQLAGVPKVLSWSE